MENKIAGVNRIQLNGIVERNSVVFYIEDTEGDILMVSRKDGSGFGLPGGKVDQDENLIEACIREIFEETGLDINNVDMFLKPVYAQFIEGFWCTCFIVVRENGEPYQVVTKENIHQKEDGVIPKFMTEDYFRYHSAYNDYNYGVSKSYKEYSKIVESRPKEFNKLLHIQTGNINNWPFDK